MNPIEVAPLVIY